MDRVGKLAQTERSNDAVLAGERYGVCNGSDGDQFEEAGDQCFAQALLLRGCRGMGSEQGVRELEGHAGSAKILIRVRAAGLVGVEDRDGLRDAFALVGEVVVGDDQVQAECGGFACGGEGADAGVDRDDETDAFGGGFIEADVLDAVAFAQAVRNVVADARWAFARGYAFDGCLEQDRGGGAVDVVVAVDEDRLAKRDRLLDAGNRGGHALHEERRIEAIERGIEEGLRVRDAAGCQQGSDERGALKLSLQRGGFRRGSF